MDESQNDPERGFERQDLEHLVAERITAGEAYRSVHLGPGLVLFRLGKGWIVLVEVLILLAMAVGIVALQSVLAAILGIIGLIVMGVYTEAGLEDWVAAYNARVDEDIRHALGRDAEP